MRLAQLLLVSGRSKIFEAKLMIRSNKCLMDYRGDLTATNLQSYDLPRDALEINNCLKTNFGKTWHADCRKKAVSKILDWLVL